MKIALRRIWRFQISRRGMCNRRHAMLVSVIAVLGGGASLVATGCSGADSTGIPPVVTSKFFQFVQLNVGGAAMATVAPYDTLQLIPTAYASDGTTMTVRGPVRYTVSDTTLTVSSTGLIRVKHPTTSNSFVICSMQDTVQNVTHTDTAFILGTSTVPASPLASFSIQPQGTDSAILDIPFPDLGNTSKTVTVTATNAAAQPIAKTALKIHFRSLDVFTATVNATSGALKGLTPGNVLITATTTYYGVTKTDTLHLRIGLPDVSFVTDSLIVQADGSNRLVFWPANLVVGVNKTVIFGSYYVTYNGFDWEGDRASGQLVNHALDVIFDDSSAAQMSPMTATALAKYYAANGSGNVRITVPDSLFATFEFSDFPDVDTYCQTSSYPCVAARSFSTAGTYHYHSAATGATGTITVVAP